MHDAVNEALTRWSFRPHSIVLAAHRENAVYRVETEVGVFALRLHRPGYRSLPELNSELLWMQELERNGLSVPRPVPSHAGLFVETCGDHDVSMLTWKSGVPLGQSGTPLALDDATATFFAIGRQAARLHTISDAWAPPPGFTRTAWDAQGLIGDNPCWGRFWENPGLSESERQTIAAVRRSAGEVLASDHDIDYGLIHADLLRENILLDGSTVTFIDFDDGGPGFRLFELATALHRNRYEPRYADLESSLIAGYRSVRPLATQHLKMFIALRSLTYLGWIIPRMHEAGKSGRNPKIISEAIAACTEFLSQRDKTYV